MAKKKPIGETIKEISVSMRYLVTNAVTKTELNESIQDLKTFFSNSYARRFEIVEDDVRRIKTKLGIK